MPGEGDSYNSDNIWTQGTIDPQMYTSSHHQEPQDSYQLPQVQYHPSSQSQEDYQHTLTSGSSAISQGEFQLPHFPQGGYVSTQEAYQYPQGASSYQIPPQHSTYELPPINYNNEGYSSYGNPTSYSMYALPSNPAMSYQSFGQPNRTSSNQDLEEDYVSAYQPDQESAEVPETQPLPGYSQAMQRMNLYNEETQSLGRIRTGGGDRSGDDYGHGGTSSSSARHQQRGSRKGKQAAVREAQTARLPFKNKDDRTTFMEPSTARLDGRPSGQKTIDRFQVRFANKERVEQEWIRRHLSHQTHPQELAAQVCEIKINYPGVESSIGHSSFLLVQKFNDPEYLYDYQGWSICYRMRVNSLRGYYNKKCTAEELKEILLSNFRKLTTTFHGTMADPKEEEADMKRARDVWMHFYKARLAGLTNKDSELTIPLIAQQAMDYRHKKKTSRYDTMVMIKKYMRIALHFAYSQIEELDNLMKSRLVSDEE